MLGRSGSGKSTLLRMMAGLIPPSEGTITNSGTILRGAQPRRLDGLSKLCALPWLTVFENVELGLEARNVNRASRARRSLRVIDIVGLDGFERRLPERTFRRDEAARRLRARARS